MKFDELSGKVIGCALEVHKHEAQILTYMKLAGVETGLLMNFNVTRLKDGIKRFVL